MNSIPIFKPIRIRFYQLLLAIMLVGFLAKPPGSLANPVTFPIITEILFTAEGYQLELLMWDYYEEDFLDNYRIIGLNGTGYFLPGIAIPEEGLVVVSQDDFYPEFVINPVGDALYMEHWDGNGWQNIDYIPMIFGDVPDPYQSWVSAQMGEESIAYQILYGMPMSESWAVKELPHSIGSDPMHVSLREEFFGHVRNYSNQPLSYITLKYCEDWFPWAVPEIITDDSGYFYTDSMFCRKYRIVFMNGDISIDSTIIFIEPYTLNQFEFYIDYLPTSSPEIPDPVTAYSIQIVPNPVNGNTKFILHTDNSPGHLNGVIKIFNPEGIIAGIIPAVITGTQQELNFEPPAGRFPPGLYVCTLEAGGKKLASQKMIISR